jgi:recombination protein RecR
MLLPPLFKKIIQIFESLPDIGPRQAIRLFMWIVKKDEKYKKQFIDLFQTLFQEVKFCEDCFFPSLENRCDICKDPRRSEEILMVIGRETDLISIETTKAFEGKYFILGGLILPFEEKTLIEERLNILQERLKKEKIKEVIIGLPYTREAEPTRKKLESILKRFPKIKISYLGKGVPSGGEIEFGDPETLKEALERRK